MKRFYRERFNPTLEPLLELDFDRVLVTHGGPVMKNGKRELRGALRAQPWYHHVEIASPAMTHHRERNRRAQGLVGQTIGPSDWREVTQEDIDQFAEVSGDDQWIHVDIERAKTESPFGTTMAHGNLTLSMIDGFRSSCSRRAASRWASTTAGTRCASRRRCRPAAASRRAIETLAVDEVGGGWFQVVQKWTMEIEGPEKPACVAESVGRVLLARAAGAHLGPSLSSKVDGRGRRGTPEGAAPGAAGRPWRLPVP